jgi:hypothetical protein
MSYVGGSVKDFSISGRTFPPTADSDVTIKLGGYVNERQSNGNGTGRKIMTAESGGVEGLKVAIDHSRNDPKFLQDIADGKDFVEFTITLADDNTYMGKVTITDMPGFSSKDATAELKLAAEGKITRQ